MFSIQGFLTGQSKLAVLHFVLKSANLKIKDPLEVMRNGSS